MAVWRRLVFALVDACMEFLADSVFYKWRQGSWKGLERQICTNVFRTGNLCINIHLDGSGMLIA